MLVKPLSTLKPANPYSEQNAACLDPRLKLLIERASPNSTSGQPSGPRVSSMKQDRCENSAKVVKSRTEPNNGKAYLEAVDLAPV